MEQKTVFDTVLKDIYYNIFINIDYWDNLNHYGSYFN